MAINRDDAPVETSKQQWSLILVVAYVAVFVSVIYFNVFNISFEGDCMAKCLGKLSIQLLRENPLFLVSDSSTSNKLGALEWYKFVHGHLGWRLVTCVLFHAGFIHFLLHMFNLIFIGIHLQKPFGFVTVVIIYMLSGFCGSILSSTFLQHNFSVGASGALFGLLGAILFELLLTNIRTIYKAAALFVSNIVIVVIHFANIGAFGEEDSAS